MKRARTHTEQQRPTDSQWHFVFCVPRLCAAAKLEESGSAKKRIEMKPRASPETRRHWACQSNSNVVKYYYVVCTAHTRTHTNTASRHSQS